MDCNINFLDNGGPEITGPPGRPVVAANGAQPMCFIDRWWGHRGGQLGYSVGNLGANGYPNQIVLMRDQGDTLGAAIVVGQSTGVSAHPLSMLDLIGRSLTRMIPGLPRNDLVFSVDVRKGVDFSGTCTLEIVTSSANANICSGAWNVEAQTSVTAAQLQATWQRFQVVKSGTWSLGGLPGARVLGVRVKFDAPQGTAGPDDTLYFTGAKLELTSTGSATPYAIPPIHESLQRCKRFYQAFGGGTNQFSVAGAGAASAVDARTYLFPVEMINVPTGTKTGKWSVANCSQPAIAFATTTTFALRTTVTSNGKFSYAANSFDDLIVFDAEVP
jgi:hypothetical protein